MDPEKKLLINCVDFLLRDPSVNFDKRSRLAPLNITYQDSFADEKLQQIPAAMEALLNDKNPRLALNALDKLHQVHEKETQSRNYAPRIQGHHTQNAANSYHLTSDFSIEDAQTSFDVGRANGIVHGTVKELILPVTPIAHQRAHIDPISHKTNFSNYNNDFVEACIRLIKDPEERALAVLPLQQLQAKFSNYVYNSPEEKKVRRLASEILGITPSQLTSLLPNDKITSPTGKIRKGSFATAAKANLTQEDMKEIIQKAYGSDPKVKDMIEPNQIVEVLKTKGPRTVDRKGSPGLMTEALKGYRKGQRKAMEIFKR